MRIRNGCDGSLEEHQRQALINVAEASAHVDALSLGLGAGSTDQAEHNVDLVASKAALQFCRFPGHNFQLSAQGGELLFEGDTSRGFRPNVGNNRGPQLAQLGYEGATGVAGRTGDECSHWSVVYSSAASRAMTTHVRRGPLYMMAAAVVFTVMVVGVKHARESLSALEVILWRGVVAVPLVAALGFRALTKVHAKGVLLLRCVLGFLAIYCFVTAIKLLSVADVAILHRLQPLVIAIIAPWFLGDAERPGPRIWLAMGLGLFGSMLILQPSVSGYSELAEGQLVGGLWAIGGAVFSAGAHICLRALGEHEDARSTVFWFQLSLLPMALSALVLEQAALPGLPPHSVWSALLTVGVAAALGQLLITQAYRIERAATNAAASFSGPVWAYLADWWLFDTLPTIPELIGGACVVSAGLALIFQRPAHPDGSNARRI